MDDHLSLSIRLLGQSQGCIHLRLLLKNCSDDKLLLPFPEITDFRFIADKSLVEAEWFTTCLVSSSGQGMPLQAGAVRTFDFEVWSCDTVERVFGTNPDNSPRWCVGLTPGTLNITYHLQVDANYFDGDTHWRFADLERCAASMDAIAWQGKTQSNMLRVTHA